MNRAARAGLALFAGLLLALPFSQAQAGDPVSLSVTVDRESAIYRPGETVGFLARLNVEGKPAEGLEIEWVLSNDGIPLGREGRTRLSDGTARIEGSLPGPGFLRCHVTYRAGEKAHEAAAAAGVDPTHIPPSRPVPADFRSFWSEALKKLSQMPLNARLTPIASPDDSIEVFDFELDSEGAPATGYLARPRGAKPGSLPIILTLHSASGLVTADLGKTVDWARTGALVCDLTPHGLPNGRPKEFYQAAGKSPALNGFRTRGRESRDTLYFRTVFLRVARTVGYLASRPEWDGRTFAAWGSSMGGGQALAAAGLDPRVSFVAANMPALCDHTGVLADRPVGWPRYLKAPVDARDRPAAEAVRYVDGVNFAAQSRAEGFFVVGFIDSACPPTTVYSAYNAWPGPKTMMNLPQAGHTLPPAVREAMRKAVLDHIARSGAR